MSVTLSVTETHTQNDNEAKKDDNIEQSIAIVNERNTQNSGKSDKNEGRSETDALKKGNRFNKSEDVRKDSNVFGLFEEDKSSRTVWVQFQGFGGEGYQDGGGLDYDPSSRNSFVKIVFCILLVKLLITAGCTIYVYTTPDLRNTFLRYNMLILIIGAVIMMIICYGMACSPCMVRPPCIYFTVLLGVMGMTLICCAITARYDTRLIFIALLATMGTVFVCILLACSSFDFTRFYIYVVAIAAVFCILSMIVSITLFVMHIKIPVLRLVILFIGTIINVVILIMQLQFVLGGRTIELDESDYLLGAFLLYTSIVDIFLQMIQMLGIADQML